MTFRIWTGARRSGLFRRGGLLGVVRVEGPNAARFDGPAVAFQGPGLGLALATAANGQQDGQCQSDTPVRAHGSSLLPLEGLMAGSRPHRRCVSPWPS